MMDCETILRALKGSDNEAIREAAFHAGERQCEEAVPVLVDLLRSSNLGVQEASEHALRMLPGKLTVKAIIPLLESDEAPVRNLSMDILREVGGQDVDQLLDLLNNRDADLRIFAADILGSTGDEKAIAPLCTLLLEDPEVNVRYQAAVSLGALGSAESAQCLNQAMRDEEWVQFSVIEALIKIRDASSVDALLAALGNGSDLVDSMIVEALGEMGNTKAVPKLFEKLDGANPALRNKIVQALVKLLGEKGLQGVPADAKTRLVAYMLHAAGDEDTDVQDASIKGLSLLNGQDAAASILDIAKRLDPEKEADRYEMVIGALRRIGLNDALIAALSSEDERVERVAVEVLGGLAGKEVSEQLIEVFWDKDRDLQRHISSALCENSGPEARQFFFDVLQRHKDGHVIKQGLKFLGEKLKDHESTEDILDFLDHRFDDVKEAALNAAISLGNEKTVERFDQMFESQDPMHRFMAVYAFGNLDVNAFLDKLKAALDDEVPDIRKIAVEAVGSVCATSPETVSLLAQCLHDEHSEVRMAVMEVLRNCAHLDALEYMVEALNDEDDWVRIRALEALAERKERSTVTEIKKQLDNPNTLVKLKTIESLGVVGGDEALEALRELADHDDPEIMDAVQDALQRCESERAGEA